MQCGNHKRTWQHITHDCTHKPARCPNLHLLTTGQEQCTQQVQLLRELAEGFRTDNEIDLRGKTVRLLDNETPTTYYVTKKFFDGTFRTMNTTTGKVRTDLQLKKLYKEGKVYITKE